MSDVPSNIPPIASVRRPPAPRRRIWPTLLLASVVFLAGMGFGAAATVIIAIHRVRNAIQHPEQAPARLAIELKRRLALDGSQTQAVQRILEARQRRLQLVRRAVQPDVERELDAARTEISAVLRPEQRQKWEATYQQIKTNWLPPAPQ